MLLEMEIPLYYSPDSLHQTLQWSFKDPVPRFTFLWRRSLRFYDLLIENVTESDLGLYYCATMGREEQERSDGAVYYLGVYRYGNATTTISFENIHDSPDLDCVLSWVLVLASKGLFLLLVPAAFWVVETHGESKEERQKISGDCSCYVPLEMYCG
ncbi:unnamed protein product [Coregonus sp. 'balchen']|nr:unnamed protein product [Coregonus sp. 'balchen']